MRTISVGRSVSSCESLPGESGAGAVRVGLVGVGVGDGDDGALDPPQPIAIPRIDSPIAPRHVLIQSFS